MSDFRNKLAYIDLFDSNLADIDFESLLIIKTMMSTFASNVVNPEKTQLFLAKAIEIMSQSDDESKICTDLVNLRDSMVKQFDLEK